MKRPAPRAADVEAWVFDLDNTLYTMDSLFLEAIGERMTGYVANLLGVDRQEAYAIQKRYHDDYGATLAGLMEHHGADPHDFLHYVHDLDLTQLQPDPALGSLIGRLPGMKLVFTNGSRAHADRVVRRLGLEGLFDAHFAIEDAGFTPKPHPTAFGRLLAQHPFEPRSAVMIEDLARNLAPAHALGLTTVLVGPKPEALPDHVHHHHESLHAFLTAALAEA